MFKLPFNIPRSLKKIDLSDPICLIGSCFSDEMSKHLSRNKFNHLSNPFGTIYNPHSIVKLLSGQVSSNRITESQGVSYHWDAHGVISGLSKKEVEKSFEHKQIELQNFLSSAKWLIITLGTSFVYVHSDAGVVANCHKVPATSFKKRLLNQKEIIDQFSELHSHLSGINQKLNILFTISPVRHIRDGLIENNRSKAILLDAVHTLTELYDNVGYFPSYEILIDELRDYRFYQSDMIHPSEEASEYIWNMFSDSYFDQETKKILSEWGKIRTALNHKPFQPKSEPHQKFLKSTLKKLLSMNGKMDVTVELEQLKNQIK
ncbi:GSCFA domain-containing protein [Ekhidna sp.]|uniref:GSCFA domain-containing protein n=1 Tax=Ekhidna sp. TaxID=2608089 RepID=UPI0032998C9E